MLAEEGCALVLGARDTAQLADVAAELEAAHGTPVVAQGCDVTSSEDLAALSATALERFGRVDIVVANAGIGTFGPIVAFDEERFRAILDVNVLGVWRTMQAFAEALAAAPTTGLLLVMSSDVSARVFPDGGPYVASKHAVRALTRTFQQEHPQLRVCELRPGSTRTAFNEADPHAPPGDGQLTAAEVADAVRVVVRAPDGVRIEELALRSIGQAPSY
jgi:3-oxoacyl-[acyl-carrier protein] reductase